MGTGTPDISRIRGLVQRARRRLRVQHALEGATTAVIIGAVAALASVYAVRAYMVAPSTGLMLLLGSVGIVVGGALIAALRPIDDEEVARHIDRASNLSDRLSTAVAFERVLQSKPALTREVVVPGQTDDETRDLMRAAIRDALKAAPKADVRRATPFRAPRDLRVAGLFAGLALLAAGLGLPQRDPEVFSVTPTRGERGSIVEIRGKWLCGPEAGALDVCTGEQHHVDVVVAGPGAITTAAGGNVLRYPGDVIEWMGGSLAAIIPEDAPIGNVMLEVRIGEQVVGRLPFEVIDLLEEQKNAPDAISWEDDDLAYILTQLEDIRAEGEREQSPEILEFVDKVEELIEKAEQGELTKEQLLEELQKAKDALDQGEEPDQKEVDKDLAETGKELQKNEQTKDLGKALENNDLEKAKEEMEKLAEKMEKGELDEKEKKQVAEAMEKAAKQYEKKQQQREKEQQEKIEKAEKELKKLQKEKDEAKSEEEKQKAEKRLEKKKRELQQLQKDQEKKEKSEQRRALKRLHKDMEDAAKDLQKKPDKNKDKQEQEQEDRENQKQASRKMKSAAEETGRVERDKRKTAAKKKVASQMDDLREAMNKAKRRGSKGPKNPFGKNGKQSDFERRARGQKGNKGAWGKGKGKGKGKGEGENGGDADGKPDGPSDTWGTGHDPDFTGDPTAKSGNVKDEDLQGKQGKGPSRRETILSAAQKGFASKGYEKVYQDYKKIVEEVMRNEKVPSSYKYYIKKYFTKIKPHTMD